MNIQKKIIQQEIRLNCEMFQMTNRLYYQLTNLIVKYANP